MSSRQRHLLLIIALSVALVATLLPAAIAAGSFRAVVTSESMRVYRQQSPHKYLGTLARGTTVTVKAYSGNAALISYNGRTGLAHTSDMARVDAVADPSATPAATPVPATTASPGQLQSAKPMVANRDSRVYRQPKQNSSYVTVKSGTQLGLLAVSGNVAKVIFDGAIGYMPAGHLSDPQAAQPTPTPAPTDAEQAVQYFDDVPVVTVATARVYSKPSTSSSYVTVAKGTAMTLSAVRGDCAMVRRDGRVGYVSRSLLTTETVATPAPTTAVHTEEGKVEEGDAFVGSNEDIIYKFLTRVAGYNTAAACGIMANIKYESGYRATSGGDSGKSYGIVQWNGARKTRLINWCKNNGQDYTSLKGQLYFLQYELKRYYPAVHNKLVAVPNTEQGAYDAGYDFCYRFEAPSNRASRSVSRANYARTTLWKRYS